MHEVQIIHIHQHSEIAAVVDAEGRRFGGNLWEIVGHARACDGFTNWKFEEMK